MIRGTDNARISINYVTLFISNLSYHNIHFALALILYVTAICDFQEQITERNISKLSK